MLGLLAMLFSPVGADLLHQPSADPSPSAVLACRSLRPDNLCASSAPVSRGQIGRAAASYVLAERESNAQHGRYGEPNIVTSTSASRTASSTLRAYLWGRAYGEPLPDMAVLHAMAPPWVDL